MAPKRPAVDSRAKRLRVLARDRTERDALNLVLIESSVVLEVAIEAGVTVETVVAETGRLTRRDEVVLAAALDQGAELVEVAAGSLASLVDATSPQPLAAVARRRHFDLAACMNGATLVLVAVDLADPGNLGTVIRSAEAAGADLVVVAGTGVDPWSPKVVRSSAGAVFLVPLVRAPAAQALAAAGAAGLRRLAADPVAGEPYDAADLRRPVALVIGNEAHGLPTDIDSLIDGRVHISVAGRSESLNAAMAASILVFEASRQRRQVSRSAP